MAFLSGLAIVVGIVTGLISLYEFSKSKRQPGVVFGVVAAGMLVAAFVVTNLPASPQNRPPEQSTQTVDNTPQGTGGAPTPVAATPTPPQPTSYTANWSQGNDVWGGTSDWSVYGGMLH